MKPSTIALAALSLLVASPADARQKTAQAACRPNQSSNVVLRQPSESDGANQLMIRGKVAEAAHFYRKTLNRNPKDIAALNGLGMALGKQFKLDSADEQFDKALKLDAKNALAHCGKSMVLLRRLQSSSLKSASERDEILARAEEQSMLALKAQCNLPEAHYSLALVYKEQGKLTDATIQLQQAIKLDPAFSEAYAELGTINLAQSDLETAQTNFKKALSLNSGNSQAHYGLGRYYIKQDRLDDAIKELNISLYQNPHSAPAHEALGAAFELQGNNTAAIREYQEAIRVKPENAQAYVRIAQIREKRGDLQHAIAELRAAIEIIPDNAGMHLWVARQSLQAGKLDDALASYAKALDLDPTSSEAAVGWGRAYFLQRQKHAAQLLPDMSDTKHADELLEQLAAANPDNLELALTAQKVRILSGKQVGGTIDFPLKSDSERFAYIELLLTKNDFGQASKEMSSMTASAKTSAEALRIAQVCSMIHDLSNAETAYRKAIELGAGERGHKGIKTIERCKQLASAYKSEAKELAHHKKYDKAIEKYESALVQNPYDYEAHLALAKLLENKSPSTELSHQASRHYLVYLNMNPNLDQRHRSKIKKKLNNLHNGNSLSSIAQTGHEPCLAK